MYLVLNTLSIRYSYQLFQIKTSLIVFHRTLQACKYDADPNQSQYYATILTDVFACKNASCLVERLLQLMVKKKKIGVRLLVNIPPTTETIL